MSPPRSRFYRERLAELHQQLMLHPVVHQHLNGQQIRFDGIRLLPDNVFSMPFGDISVLELTHLLSIFNGSRVHQQAERKAGPDDAPAGLYFTVINNRLIQAPYKNRIGLYTEQSRPPRAARYALHIDYYYLNASLAPRYLGRIAFALCVITAYLWGLSKISLIAAGGIGYPDRYIGYQIWPRLGFDARLLPEETSGEARLSECATVQEVLAADEAWWIRKGTQRLMVFDLAPHSASWEKLVPCFGTKVMSGGGLNG